MIGRPREFDREAALDAAMRVFWRKGFAAASMNDLCEAMGIRSPSLYAAFGGKEALYVEAVDHYVRTIGPTVWRSLTDAETARAGIETLLLAATEILPGSDNAPGGCMAMLGAVSDEWPGAVAEVVKTVRAEMLNMIRSRLEAALVSGELVAETDVDRLSRLFFSILQGMAVQARDGAAPAQLRGVAEAAMAAWPGEASG